jgi:hypothetical protein
MERWCWKQYVGADNTTTETEIKRTVEDFSNSVFMTAISLCDHF